MFMEQPITPDAQPAESSPAPIPSAAEQALAAGDQSAYRRARSAELSGKPLEPSDATSAESSPAKPAEQAASTDAKEPAASEPAKPSKSNAETRIKELLAERHRQDARIAELEASLRPRQPAQPETKPAASSTASVLDSAAFPTFDKWLEQDGNTEKAYEDYIDARSDHRFEQHEQKRQAKEAEIASKRELETKQARSREKAQEFAAEHPDFADVVGPLLRLPDNSPAAIAIVDAVTESGPKLLYALGQDFAADPNKSVLKRLFSLPERLALYELGKFEAALPSTVSPSPKLVTSVTDTPTILGKKPSGSPDELAAAVRSGDQSAFKSQRWRQMAQR